jgi:hypothetical protein
MGLDISNFGYVCFHLGPYLVVSYFLIQSILIWELRGFIYLCGLLLTALLAYLCNGPLNALFSADAAGAAAGATFAQDVPTFVLFQVLAALEIFWIVANNCVAQPLFAILVAVLLSAAVGAAWAGLVLALKNDGLTYRNDLQLGQKCSMNTKTLFNCRPKKF